MAHELDIPAYLRIPQETRRAAWARVKPQGPNDPTPPHASPTRGPGSVCRRAGIPDGIDQGLVDHVEMLEAAREAQRKASLYAMDEKRQQEKRECDNVRAVARKANGKTKRKPRRQS